MKRSSILVLCLVLVCCMLVAVSCSNAKPVSITITSANNVTEIKMGETLQLTATVSPDDASQDIVWESGNEKVATVSSSGLVTAVAEGNVVITATSAVDSTVSKKFALVVTYKSLTPPADTTPTEVKLSTPGNVTAVAVGKSLQITAEVRPAAASQEVTYASDNTAVATVSSTGLVTGVAEGSAVITVTSKEASTVFAKITITVGASAANSYESMSFCTHEDYMSAEKGTELKVKGVVTYVLPVYEGTVSYYVQNGEDGYYIYKQDATNFPVELGATYAVGGTKNYYQGVNELQDVEYCVKLTESLTATTVSLEGKDVSSLSEMSPYHCAKVSATAQIKSLPTNYTKAFSVTVTIGGKDTTVYVNPNNMSESDFAALVEKFSTSAAGSTIEVTGVMSAYGYGTPKPQILVFSADEIVAAGASPAQKVEVVKDSISIASYVGDGANSIELPTTSSAFDDVTISWASDNTAVIAADGTVTHPATDTVVTLTATVSHSTASVTATTTCKVYVTGAQFNGTKTVEVTFDEAEVVDAGKGNYGVSNFKGSYFKDGDNNQTYEANTVEIGGHHWLLWNAMVSKDGNDHVTGSFGVRTQANADATKTGRVQLMDAGNYDYVQFDAAVYGSNALGIKLAIEYKLEGSDEWVVVYTVSINSYEQTTYRFVLPEGVKMVAISVVPNSGARVNIDTISLGTIAK